MIPQTSKSQDPIVVSRPPGLQLAALTVLVNRLCQKLVAPRPYPDHPETLEMAKNEDPSFLKGSFLLYANAIIVYAICWTISHRCFFLFFLYTQGWVGMEARSQQVSRVQLSLFDLFLSL